ncbi:hypothetical protein [Streptomyces sp. NPDC057579]|uniref:hypothetical protein n=1 Tax=Streptomyces sp. NPDC057579 TaxID=3346172 RepID=UPI00367683E5
MLPISSGMRSRSIAAAANQAVPAQIVRRAAVGSCARFLLLGGRLLQGVPVGQVRRGQSLEKRTDWYYGLNHFQYRVIGEKHCDQVTYRVDVQKRYDWGATARPRRAASFVTPSASVAARWRRPG